MERGRFHFNSAVFLHRLEGEKKSLVNINQHSAVKQEKDCNGLRRLLSTVSSVIMSLRFRSRCGKNVQLHAVAYGVLYSLDVSTTYVGMPVDEAVCMGA